MKETILVTGGTGFIGSHTTVELQQAGYDVVIIDNLSNSNAAVVDGIEKITGIRPAFEKVDLNDFAATEAVFQKYQIKGCIHFAASKAVGESVEKPLLYYRNNLNSLMNVLELMAKYGGKGIIFSSSCTVYGQPTPENLPVTEQAPIQKALSPYGKAGERRNHPGLHPLGCTSQEHHPSLLQPYRRSPISPHRRTSKWRTNEPHSICHSDCYRHPQAAQDIWQ